MTRVDLARPLIACLPDASLPARSLPARSLAAAFSAATFLATTLLTATSCTSEATVAGSPDCETSIGTLQIIDVDVEPIAPAGSETALLWLPPCANVDRLQLVVLMHGAGLSPATWFDEPVGTAAVAERLDRGRVDTAVLAPGGADGNQFFVDHTLEPLLAAVEAELGSMPPIAGIGGYSAGGPTVARLAFGPDRLEVNRVVLSAPVWASHYTTWIEDETAATSITSVLLDAGADDGLARSLAEIAGALDASGANVETELERPPGGHSVAYMGRRIDVWLPFLAGVELLDVPPPPSE